MQKRKLPKPSPDNPQVKEYVEAVKRGQLIMRGASTFQIEADLIAKGITPGSTDYNNLVGQYRKAENQGLDK